MKNPFYPRERRLVTYYLFVILQSIIVYILANSLEEEGQIIYKYVAVELVIYFLIISFALIKTIFRLY